MTARVCHENGPDRGVTARCGVLAASSPAMSSVDTTLAAGCCVFARSSQQNRATRVGERFALFNIVSANFNTPGETPPAAPLDRLRSVIAPPPRSTISIASSPYSARTVALYLS